MGKKRKSTRARGGSRKGTLKGKPYTPKDKQAKIIARSAFQNVSQVARAEGVSRGTVYRVRNAAENSMMLQTFRDMVVDLVPAAIKVLKKLIVEREDRQAVLETLYGTRVLIQRHEIEKVEDPVRTFDYTKAEFFAVHGRLPLQAELEEFEKSLPIEPLVKDDTPVQ